MKTAIINIKTKPQTKKRAQKIADELGLSLSAVINGFLNQLIKTKKVEFSAYPAENPSEYMIQALEEAKKSPTSPEFDNAKDALAWLNKEAKKYAR